MMSFQNGSFLCEFCNNCYADTNFIRFGSSLEAVCYLYIKLIMVERKRGWWRGRGKGGISEQPSPLVKTSLPSISAHHLGTDLGLSLAVG